MSGVLARFGIFLEEGKWAVMYGIQAIAVLSCCSYVEDLGRVHEHIKCDDFCVCGTDVVQFPSG